MMSESEQEAPDLLQLGGRELMSHLEVDMPNGKMEANSA